MLKILWISFCVCLVAANNADEELKGGIKEAVKNGAEKTMDVTKSIFVSSLKALCEEIQKNHYKAKNKMKKIDHEKVKENIKNRLQEEQEKYEKKIAASVKAAACINNAEEQEMHLDDATSSFKNLLVSLQNNLMGAADELRESIESFVDTKGSFDFKKEEKNDVDLIDKEGEMTVSDFNKEITLFVKNVEGKVKNCDSEDKIDDGKMVDFSQYTNDLIDQTLDELEKVREAADA